MAEYLPLPDGSFATVREGETPNEAWVRSLREYPEAFAVKETPKQKERPGLLESAQLGGESLISSERTGLASLLGDKNEAVRNALQRQQSMQDRYAEQPSYTEVKKKYEEEGLLPAIGEYVRQIPNAMAEQAPQIAQSVAGAKVGARFGPEGALAGAFIPSYLQQ